MGVMGGWVVVDVETSGMKPSVDRVLSVAAVVIDDDGEVVEEFATLLNPGVDPGPVHVHGLTPALLAGKPRFADVAAELDRVLDGRTVVAHNATFDASFLASEARRAGTAPPLERFLCTLDFAGRLHLSTADLKLATLAAHFGVEQRAAHDAHDDALVLAGIFAGMLEVAAAKDVQPTVRELDGMLPDPETGFLVSRVWAEALAAPRLWRPAGKLRRSGGLVQGMEVVFTQDVDRDPEEVAGLVVDKGLYLANRISSRTSLAVCDAPGAVRGRAAFARRKGLELVPFARFEELLTCVAPGRPVAGAQAVDSAQEALF
ncbi:exonuclease domain-containing protein [Rhodococcus sp. IEGM 1408]|uniref:exonuclease domain-containing protein n=1 Tax=Rhodococcus sp. IEGM 1408 TaxID=3082220 RepID=UPI0029544ABD|nr:exonuclease domain-containing protein [Rhodococcus sp. IEGM 1408]MDV8002183.1 exonuclease domain-containing protein [Rhodococcus sp. IEGM 1408]